MVGWSESLCRQLADSGLCVIRCDNRDTIVRSDDRTTYDYATR